MFLKDSKSTTASASPSQAAAETRKPGSGVPSIISPDLKITGDLKSSGDIQIDGTVEGDIDSRLLIVGVGARVEGSISAETVRVSGTVHGEVKAKSVTLDKSAKVVGDVVHENLTMEAGAFLEGGVRRLEVGGAKASVSPLRPSDSATSSGSGQGANGGYAEGARDSVL